MNVGLVFGIIFAVIVIGFILFFGIKYMGEMSETACKSQAGQQISNLEKAVKSTLALSQGSSQELRVILPNCYEKMCFVDTEHPESYPEGGWEPDERTKMMTYQEKKNVFLFKPNGVVEGWRIEKLKPHINFCMSSTKKVILRNTGSLVEIALPGF